MASACCFVCEDLSHDFPLSPDITILDQDNVGWLNGAALEVVELNREWSLNVDILEIISSSDDFAEGDSFVSGSTLEGGGCFFTASLLFAAFDSNDECRGKFRVGSFHNNITT